VIIDSDILIWVLRGNPKAEAAIKEVLPFSISVVTYMELVCGVSNKAELRTLQRRIQEWSLTIVPVNERISERAMALTTQYFHSNNMEPGDAFIAATALERNEVFFTANAKHYRFIPGLQLQVFHP
jgi:predicted nucleic acid-binding protein